MYNLSVFHDYDVRGIYGSEVDEEFYYLLGKAAATYAASGKAIVAHDMRLSSPSLFKSLVEGLTESGMDVTSLGESSTEMFYFACGILKADIGIIVSASHNPPEYNGAKFVRDGTRPIHSESGLADIRNIIETKKFVQSEKKGEITTIDVMEKWIDHVLSFVDPTTFSQLKVVIDGGNGMGGPAWIRVAERLKGTIQIVPLYLEPDGNFPHHLADPLKEENIADLKREVVSSKADVGVALDGDADRMFLVDEKGERVSGTVTTALIAEYLLSKEKGIIMYSVTCGHAVADVAKKAGVESIRTRVGHSFIKEKMREVKGLFAGEHSGHFYYRDNFYTESSLLSALLIFEYMSLKKKTLSDLAAAHDTYAQSGEMNYIVEEVEPILDHLVKTHKEQGGEIDTLDGITVEYETYWFNVRASKTEPLLRLNIEAKDQTTLSTVQAQLESDLQTFNASRKKS